MHPFLSIYKYKSLPKSACRIIKHCLKHPAPFKEPEVVLACALWFLGCIHIVECTYCKTLWIKKVSEINVMQLTIFVTYITSTLHGTCPDERWWISRQDLNSSHNLLSTTICISFHVYSWLQHHECLPEETVWKRVPLSLVFIHIASCRSLWWPPIHPAFDCGHLE